MQSLYNTILEVYCYGLCYSETGHIFKGKILQRNYKKSDLFMGYFFYNSFVKLNGKKNWEPYYPCIISKSVLQGVL